MAKRVTPATAKSALGMIDMFGTPEAGLHQTLVQMTAIKPYTDRSLQAVADVLSHVARYSGERREQLITQLRDFAARESH